MLDLRALRDAPEAARAALARRRDADALAQFDRVLELDAARRECLARVEQLRAERNEASREFGRRKQAGEDVDALQGELAERAGTLKSLEEDLREFEALLDVHLASVPNLLAADVPEGGPEDNVEVRRWGVAPRFDFAPRPHWEIGEALGLFDLPRGARITGSGFPVFTGQGARLVRALANFMLDLHVREHGYLEVQPPYLVNAATARGTGQLPKFQEDLYHSERDGLYLVPTAEVPVTNLHAGEILEAADLPLAYTAYTPCFRREAGSHGKDTRGLIRVHQFDKVELVRLVRPEESEAEHARITAHAEAVLQRLEIPYRVLALASGDTGFASARTLDLEVWAAGIGGWLEASSASTFTDFQARRANIRFRPAPGAKPEFVHTLNASGVAFPRTIIALLENGQQADGSVRLPEALAPYVGTDRLVARA
ncbi:MAG: serine--tRNA ligase [Gemmatimonadetes bacterium]|nr:serine--tRNA ligase [Gemmatimonadota bacterium]MCB9504933.1 serine--tRNA ligase [Gemmatimonadales bacterium]MCA9762304.1 serine--tRNA ligase [Gemmatimonadota bacterium]MCB9518252.1 serine--tRNA ligase [Gemmatimonadales bacterium]HPF62539.1 serine--tRNA ligase [Gemmatimonadales bacterium]